MKIVIATPLYPPDIAEPAPYVKELAKRLKSGTFEVKIVTFGRLPEKIDGVEIMPVSKQQPLPARIIAYTQALLKASKDADLIYALNGASVELPSAIVNSLTRKKLVLRIGDKAAHTHAQKSFVYGLIESLAKNRATHILTDELPKRPEIISFESYSTEKIEAYNHAWEEHVQSLEKIFSETHHA